MDGDPLMIAYHDKEWGRPVHDDHKHFEYLVLDAFQAGLSWRTVLHKRENFRRAFSQFNPKIIAKYDERKVKKLLKDAGIIRNRLKIESTIDNAKRIKIIQKEHGSFKNWLDGHHLKSRDEWVKLFKTTFRFTGGEIVNEFLISTGYLKGAHVESCPVYKKVMKQKPKWAERR